MTTLASQLTEARDSLTKETWNKGAYFADKNGTLCMCAHGAIQAVVNPQVKNAISVVSTAAVPSVAAYDAARTFTAATATAAVVDRAAAERQRLLHDVDILSLYNTRPEYTKKPCIYNDKDYGKTESSYLLGLFGLTSSFNDNTSTTLEMIKEKYTAAIEFAEKHGL